MGDSTRFGRDRAGSGNGLMSPQPAVDVEKHLDEFASHISRQSAGQAHAHAQERPWLARAAGPLDCMGGFAEYCGSLTLTLPTSEYVCCAAQMRADEQVHISLMLEGQGGPPQSCFLPLSMWYESGHLA